ncbi:response regulator [Rhodoferax ferrireducens]|uniref:response regulator n=1 Tax=Rhodoferax ferrireducens TaxID=192843 RepID=UPI000E0CFB0E|nr:response regulator [Rhodoferax ferrireducens]
MKKLTIESRLIGGFAIALVLLLLAGGQMYRSLQEYKNTSDWVVHTYQVRGDLEAVASGMREQESGQRAYIITGKEFFLAEREREAGRIRSALTRIGQLTVDNPRQQLRSAALSQLADARFQLLDKSLAEYRAEGFEKARERMQTGVSHASMEALVKQIDAMDEEERTLLKQRSDQVERNANQALAVGALLVVIAMVGFFLLWRRTRREVRVRQAAESAVLESEQLLKQILELLPVGVFVANAAGHLTQVNPAGRAIWAGERSTGLEHHGEQQGWWPDTGKPLAVDEWAMARTLKAGETIRDELVDIRCFDGSRKTITNSSMPIRDVAGRIVGGVVAHVDVTAFKRTERQLRAAARFDETQGQALALFAASFDRRRILDGLLALLAQQQAFPVSALYGFDEWSGRFRREAAHGLDGAAPREFALGEGLLGQAAQSGKTIVLDAASLTLQTGLADFTPTQVLMIPVSYQDRRLAVLVLAASSALDDGDRVFLDRLAAQLGVALHNLRQYSDLKQLAEQLRASSDVIAAKNLQLEEASRMKSEFLSNMSHELRTPLNAIIGFSEVLRDGLMGELSPQQKEYVNDIFTSGGHLLSLINDILDLSKVEAGRMTLELEPLPAATLVQAGLQVVREKAMANRQRLTVEVASDLGEVWLDARKVKQILYNLLSNAVKFTPEGGEVHVTARRVAREAVPGGSFANYLELAVRDTGIGISAEDQAQLFRPFTQIDSTLARRHEGTGLGLVMVKRLTELHGGTVALHSTPGQGSTFTVWLPWRSAEDKAEASDVVLAPTSMREGTAPSASYGTVGAGQPLALVIEDDDKAAELLRLQLVGAGFRIVRAITAESALELATQECPDLITLDIMLPGMDGWEFLERFKQHPQFAAVPVVIISIVADRNRGSSLGAAQVLQKPVGREELARALAAVGFPASADGEHRTVLVVDDDPKAVQLISTYLDPGGYRVLPAFGGQEGIDVARRQPVDLIVLDLMMPEVNGFDVVEALKRDAATASIPIIVVTAKQITAEDRTRLNGAVLKVIEKSDFNHGRFIGEVRRAMTGKGQ